MFCLLFIRSGHCEEYWENDVFGQVNEDKLEWAEENGFSFHHDQEWNVLEGRDADEPDDFYDCSLTALGLSHDLIKTRKLNDWETSCIRRVTISDADSNICLLDG